MITAEKKIVIFRQYIIALKVCILIYTPFIKKPLIKKSWIINVLSINIYVNNHKFLLIVIKSSFLSPGFLGPIDSHENLPRADDF